MSASNKDNAVQSSTPPVKEAWQTPELLELNAENTSGKPWRTFTEQTTPLDAPS